MTLWVFLGKDCYVHRIALKTRFNDRKRANAVCLAATAKAH